MRRFVVTVLAWIGGFALLLFIAIFFIATVLRPGKGRVPSKAVLEINLETDLIEDRPDDPFARLTGQNTPVVRDIVEALEKARDDGRVSGVIARIGAAPISMAQSQEIRDAIAHFRTSKKFAIAWAETFGEFGPGNGAYYLATAFDEIWLQPSGDIGLTGLMFQSMFLRGSLDKFGVTPRMDRRYEYKSAMEMFTEKKMTPASREATGKVIESMFGQMVKGIAAGRKLSEEEVKALVDKGPHLGKEALQAKLVDGMGYRDEVFAAVRQKAGANAEFLFLDKYLDRAGRPHQKGQTVALIYGLGGVQRGKSDFNPLGGSTTMGSDTVTAAFRQAIKDNDVKAILFRVDSPGGSYVASDSIWRETVRAKKAGKPVIVSMSSVAGSGGYFVAMAADKIVAQPATITGSIGVLGGKMVANGLFDKVGLSFDEVHAGKNSRMFSPTTDFSPEEWARFEAWLDRVYDDFTTKVADGRKLPKAKVLEIAKGRIWSGEDAKAIGLVDELGGYPTALKLVKQAIKVADSEDVYLRQYPRKKTPWEAVMAKLNGEEAESTEAKQTDMAMRVIEQLRPVMKTLHSLGLDGDRRDVLAMPDFKLIH
ncbi:MAG TPA: signal peptide peptidase SppA [Bryobacteraceae bacterium]|nr:signal peptide peptidase SppA [Bryobacteraceae bacterium]